MQGGEQLRLCSVLRNQAATSILNKSLCCVHRGNAIHLYILLRMRQRATVQKQLAPYETKSWTVTHDRRQVHRHALTSAACHLAAWGSIKKTETDSGQCARRRRPQKTFKSCRLGGDPTKQRMPWAVTAVDWTFTMSKCVAPEYPRAPQ